MFLTNNDVVVTQENYQFITDKYRSVIPDKYYEQIEDIILGCKELCIIPAEEILKWDIEKDRRELFNRRLSKTAELNNTGIAHEKAGEIEKAIAVYEENIAIGYPASHSYDRLMILYRKQKRFSDELRIIEKAIDVYGANVERKWLLRKEKALKLMNKN